MTKHPLTDEKALSLFSFEHLIDTSEPISIEDALRCLRQMRSAADWQLEQVIDWLDENICNYDTGTESCPGFFRPMSRLTVDLEKAMRPTQEDN